METTGRIMKAPALANIDENLHHLFVPQLEDAADGTAGTTVRGGVAA